jgi:hypothetical protein
MKCPFCGILGQKEWLNLAVDSLDLNQARREVASFVRHPQAMEAWSKEFFMDVAGRIQILQSHDEGRKIITFGSLDIYTERYID